MTSFDPDPTKRLNFWGLIFGTALSGVSTCGQRQEGYQRYAAMPTMSKAKRYRNFFQYLLGLVSVSNPISIKVQNETSFEPS